MKTCIVLFTVLVVCCRTMIADAAQALHEKSSGMEKAQVPQWSEQDLDFFLHGSMSTEMVPETVLRSFIAAYPDLFPDRDFRYLGLVPDEAFGWPIGFSRASVSYLGGLTSVGINCAACHVGEVVSGSTRVRVLGMTSHFDAEAFFGGLLGATFRTQDPVNMRKFLTAYLAANGATTSGDLLKTFDSRWQAQEENITKAMQADASGSKGAGAGGLQSIQANDLQLDARNVGQADLATLSHAMLTLFHNIRATLHVPDQPPDKLPPASGPGRNDAFGLLSAVLFGDPQPYAPVKYGLVWNIEKRHWVHWDGNTQSPLGRNLLAALGLGAPLVGKEGKLDFAKVQKQTELSERILAPRYPFGIDSALARKGAAHYLASCASCHDGVENDTRLHNPEEIGTQPLRAELFTQKQADQFNGFLAGLEIPGYKPSGEPGIRSTRKFWAPSLAGVWARSPYLHNGSVRTMQELLTAPEKRAKSFHRGSETFDLQEMGYTDEGTYVLDTTNPANSNSGHAYGVELSSGQKHELIEFLKTL